MRNRNGNLTATPAIQLTNDTHDPGTSSTAVGSTVSADGVSDPNGVTTVSTGAYRFVRPGWNVVLSAGTTLATASVTGVVELIRQ